MNPALTALSRAVVGARAATEAHGMGFQHANGIAAAQDGREVVGFVDVLDQNGEVGHALVQHCTQPLETTGKDGHGVMVLRAIQALTSPALSALHAALRCSSFDLAIAV